MSKLSIITINLNNAEGLRKTIESVVAQTFTDYEYIIVDGASTDSSIETIQQFDDSMIQHLYWISEPDSGVYEAMNKGIRMAKGEYLLFLNSGDFLVNKEVLKEVFKSNHSADFLLGRCNISENGIVIHTTCPPQKITFGHLYEAGLAHQASFIKREMFERYGLYREDFRYNSDIEFWYRTIILQCCTTESLSTIISDYNTDGISSKEFNTPAYLKEMEKIYSHPLLQLFIPDYNAQIAEHKDLQILYWYKSKKSLYKLLENFYKVIHRIAHINKRRVRGTLFLKKKIRHIARQVYYRWSKPISIFTCHQISDSFNPEIDCLTDWTSTDLFRRNVEWLKHKYTFISLKEAVEKLQSGKRRKKKFAVFTFDDGYSSVQNALSILKSYQIPATIFINSAYLDDAMLSPVNVVSYVNSLSTEKINSLPSDFLSVVRKIDIVHSNLEYKKCIDSIYKNIHLIKPNSPVFLTRKELENISDPLFTIGLHGHVHLMSIFLSDDEFEDDVVKNYKGLKNHKNFIPYYAYPFGNTDERKIDIVNDFGYIQFLCNGKKNYKASKVYNRIPIDGIDLSLLNSLK
jgi:glycosyltransferase involved in cell wall biosynthesis/peptidoglycan/xylan/chitin deacetylase (PgdA/CDA1 family)